MKKISLIVTLFVGAAACGDNTSKTDGGLDGHGDADALPTGDLAGDRTGTDTTPDVTLPAFKIGGTITGLVGSGLILSDNGGDALALAPGTTTFVFPKAVTSGAPYAVAVQTQPGSPNQTCTVAGGTGIVALEDVATVAVVCTTETYTIGGTITGLTGGGLVLQNNLGDDLPIAAGATAFTFATPLTDGSPYAVTVLAQPATPTQVCTVDAGTGITTAASVTNISITCVAKTFMVGGTISGLAGGGLVLQNNGGDNLDLPAGTTTFSFATPVASGAAFAVTVLVQPTAPTQTCTVTSGTGVVDADDVATVSIACATNTFTVGGTISGLTGAGLVLANNGGDNLTVPAGSTSFVFATPLASHGAFLVTVAAQPTAPAQNCTVSGGVGVVGAANISSVVVNCAIDKFTVGGQVTGLRGTLILHNGAENQTVTSDGMFAFPTPISSGGSYAVTVATQPSAPSQTCIVTNGAGQVTSANVADIAVACTTNKFHVQAIVTGLVGNGLVLRNSGENLLVHASDTVVFPTTISSGSGYSVITAIQPTEPTQTCTVGANASGVVGGADVSVPVVCVTNTYNVRVTVTGLAGAGLVLHNGADTVPVAASSTFNLPTKVASGASYLVTVAQQPTGPSQTCTVVPSAAALVGSADVAVSVSCTTNSYTVSGMITGLTGTGLVLQNNGANDLPVASGAVAFHFTVLSGGMYNVTVRTQPAAQMCTPSANMGPVTNMNVGTVVITCVTNSYQVLAAVSGLQGSGLVLQNNGGDNLPVSADGTYPFGALVMSGQPYAVSVFAQPSAPAQRCTVALPSGGMVMGANVTVAVSCATLYSVGGKIVGLVSPGLVLRNNGGDDLAVPAASPTFTFATPVPSGGSYAVSVLSSPASQACQVASGNGPVTNANISSVSVDCAVCATAPELGTFSLACPAGQTIASLDFASYGTPTGACGAFAAAAACDAPTTVAVVTAACVGQQACSFRVFNSTFTTDPCPGPDKTLAVQARCQ